MSNPSYINCSSCGHMYSLVDEEQCPFCSHDELNNDLLEEISPNEEQYDLERSYKEAKEIN